MTRTFTAEATCKPTVAALRDALAGIPDNARVKITTTSDQRDGDWITIEAIWTPPAVVVHGGPIYPPGVRGVD